MGVVETSGQVRRQETQWNQKLTNMFSSKNKKKQLSELEMLKKDWRKFKSNFEKIIMDPVKLETSSRKCLEEELKPKL